MCDANAYLVREGAEEVLLESVDLVELDGDEAKLINIFGERKILRARLSCSTTARGSFSSSLSSRSSPARRPMPLVPRRGSLSTCPSASCTMANCPNERSFFCDR